ncbi:MAG TPA: PAS domain S-box protein [Thermoanaerobaculia bacterium]|nr:PAS domain S-box protein [Thermoanaerobaculia bacterium]
MYDTAKFGGDMIVDIVRTHPVMLVGGVLQENPFYVPPDEFLAELRSREERSRAASVPAGAAAARYRDVARLTEALGHLVALGALSALEAAREPPEVAEHFAQAMLSLPAVEVVFASSDFPPHWSAIEALSVRDTLRPSPAAAEIKRIVTAAMEPGNAEVRTVAGDFAGLGAVSLFVIPLGPQGRYGWVAAGSRERAFPDPLQRALLEVGAQQLSAALRQRHLADVRAAAMAERETEERYRLAFENAAVGMAVLTLEGRFRQVNSALCRILGRPEKDLLGVDWRSVTYPEDVPRVTEAMRRLVSGETNSEILVKRGTHPSGKVVWVQNSLSAARDADGHLLHLVVLIEDITEQRRAEDGLRLLEARFSTMFRVSPAALGMGALHTGRILDVNDRWLELFGYRRDEVIGRDASELQLWADPHERQPVMDRLLRDGVVRDLETHFRRKSGELRDALLSFVRTELPGEHDPVSIAEIVDVTERRRAEGERARLDSITDAALGYLSLDDMLRELLGRLRSALSAELASVWLVDAERQFLVPRAVNGIPYDSIAAVRIPLDSSAPISLDSPFCVDDLPRPEAGRDDWYARLWAAAAPPLRSWMGCPLVLEGTAIGVVNVAATRTPFHAEDRRLLRVVADRVAPAIVRGRLVETVRESRERLAALSERVVNLQETERREMARELHDQIGQFLTGLRFMIEAPRTGGREEMLAVVNELIGRVSDLSVNLRPPMLDELGLLPALLWQIERFETQTGIRVDFHHANLDRRFAPEIEITAFRIVQEALTNVARHAGVMKARVEVWADAETLGARIADEGRGFRVEEALARYSSGLAGMRERCRLLGGQLTIESAPGTGTRLAMTLPLAPAAAPPEAGAGA